MSHGYFVENGVDRIRSGEADQIFVPRSPRKNTTGVIFVHGSGAPLGFVDNVNQPSSVKLAGMLAAAGIPGIAGVMGGQAWANDVVMSSITSAAAALRARFPNIRTDKIALIGGSMGGGGSARYCQLNPTKVSCMVGLIPLLDLTAFYAAFPGAVANEVGAAWGVTAPAALPASANINANAALAASVPLLAGYSSVDAIVPPSYVTSYVAKINAAGGKASAQVTDSTYGHSDQAVGGLPIETIGQFLVANGA